MSAKLGKYTLIKTLGEGAHSKVKLAKTENPAKYYAIKLLKKDDPKLAKGLLELVMTEVHTMKKLSHKNIVNLVEFGENGEVEKAGKVQPVLYIVLELATGGELFDYISVCGAFSEPVARFYFGQLLSALEYIHLLGVSHRDLKPENLLFDDAFDLKIADFGFSSREALNSTRLGTDNYMAPEIHRGRAYRGEVVDLFAASIILFIMVTGNPPFSRAIASDEFYKVLCVNRPDLFWKNHSGIKEGDVSKEFMALVETMFLYEPTHRLSLAELKQHPWMKGQVASAEEAHKELADRKERIGAQSVDNNAQAHDATPGPDVFKKQKAKRSGEELAKAEEEKGGAVQLAKRTAQVHDATVSNVTTFYSEGDAERLFNKLACYCEAKANDFLFSEGKFKVRMVFYRKEMELHVSAQVLKVEGKELHAVEFQRVKGDKMWYQQVYKEIKSYFF